MLRTPLGTHKTFADYANFAFHKPSLCQGGTIAKKKRKDFERKRRDFSASVIVGHACDESRRIPSKWR